MCLDFLRPKSKPKNHKIVSSAETVHEGWHRIPGVHFNPLPPELCGSINEKQKKISEPDWNPPPKSNSDTDEPATKKSEFMRPPPTESLENKNRRYPTSYEDEHNTRRTNEFKQPPPPSPDKQNMRSKEPLENNHQRERNTTEYPTSASEEENTNPRKTSSNDDKERKSARAKLSSQRIEKEETEIPCSDGNFFNSQKLSWDYEREQKPHED